MTKDRIRRQRERYVITTKESTRFHFLIIMVRSELFVKPDIGIRTNQYYQCGLIYELHNIKNYGVL